MSIEILNEFTKDEILAWLREHGMLLGRVRRRDLLFIRWQKASLKLMADYDTEFAGWDAKKLDLSKRDALAVQCNATDDISEKLRLLRAIESYDKAFHDHLDRIRKLDKRQASVDRMYRKIDEAKP